MIANYLSRQLRTIIRHAVRGSACAAFRDIARVRTKFSLGVYVHTRVYARACVLRCPWRALPAEGGERNRCTRQRDADRRCSFSFFLASPSSSAFRSASPIPLPPFPLHSPRKACLLAVSLSLLPSHSSPLSHPPLPLCLSRDRALASRDHSLRGCAAAAITARSARGLYLETRRRLVAKVTVHRECSIIERSVGMTERLRGGGKEGGFDNSYTCIYIYRSCFRLFR